MANTNSIYFRQKISIEQFITDLKDINTRFFLDFFDINRYDETVIITDPNNPDGIYTTDKIEYYYINKVNNDDLSVFDLELLLYIDEELIMPDYPASDVKVIMESPNSHYSGIFWYLKDLISKELYKKYGEEYSYDEGIGWYRPNDEAHKHSEVTTQKELKDGINKHMSKFFKRKSSVLPKSTRKFFGLNKYF